MPTRIPRPVVAAWLVCLTFAPGAGAQALPGWTLVWSDEFTQPDNSKPDTAKWGYDIGGSGWGNNELQYYTDRTVNARIESNQLVIEARAENYGGKNHTSARLLTKGRHAWTFGRIEARMKIPRGQGIWPAFWMLGTNIDAVGWPQCGEIDIMENIGSLPSNLYGTIHGPGYSGGGGVSGSYVLPGAALADDFHVYAIEWEENRIRWFIDGQQYFTLAPNNLPGGGTWVFNAPQFLILNVAVGGNWPGNPDGSTVFPQRMTVDYVRVYQSDSVNPPAGGGVLLDPGFESAGLPDWTTFGSNVYSETGATHEGARSLKIFGQFTGAANESGAWQDVTAAAGDSFVADGWLFTPGGDKIAGGNSAWIEVSFLDANDNVLSLYRSAAMTSASTAGVWRNFIVDTQINPLNGAAIGTVGELVAPAGAVTVRKRVVFRQPATAGGSVWYDDMSLTETTVVEPPAGTTVTVDPNETWLGYMNVSDLPANGGAYRYGDVWGTADLKAGFSGPILTLGPNTINNPDPYWYIGGGGPGRPGNKIMDASMYVEKTDTLAGRKVIFTGTVIENTLTGAHASVAYIKDFAPDYSSHTVVSTPLVNGTFSISMDTNPAPGRHVQYGFQTTGVNVWATDVTPFGTVKITAVNEAPDLTEIADQTISTNSESPALPFVIGDLETSPGSLVVTAGSSNPEVVPVSGIVLGGTAAERSITVRPAAGQLGGATIAVTVSDGDLSASTTFLVTVTGTALETWRYDHFGTTINAGQAADMIDSDSDGESNLMEFATGQDPAAFTLADTPLMRREESLEFSYPQSLAALADGLGFTVETSETLATLSWSPAGVTGAVVSGSGPTRTVTCTIPFGPETGNFFRLKVTRP